MKAAIDAANSAPSGSGGLVAIVVVGVFADENGESCIHVDQDGPSHTIIGAASDPDSPLDLNHYLPGCRVIGQPEFEVPDDPEGGGD